MRRICKIENCEGFVTGRGLCSKHHQRLKHSGDPNIVLRNWGSGKTHVERFWSRVNKNGPIRKLWRHVQ